MEAIMMGVALFLFVSLLGAEPVERRGITSAVKLEEIIFLTELNDKYKMRATEVTFAPGGYLGVHREYREIKVST